MTADPKRALGRRDVLYAGLVGLAATACSSPTAPNVRAAPSAPSAPITPAPTAPAAPAETAAMAETAAILCRAAWGAQPPRPGGRRHTITRMTLHHSAVVLGDNSNAPGRLRQHQRFHQNERGWIDIAYHVGVDRNGNIYELRTPDIVGDTATSYDPTGHFLVLCGGDFDQETVTDAQLDSAAMTFAWAAQNFQVLPTTLAGHRDFAATSCPGADLYAHLSSGELKRRVDDHLARGPVNLQSLCGPAAADRVAAIEAGY